MRTTAGTTITRIALSIVALVSSVVAACCFYTVWSYWYRELDADCPNGRDCTCLLFGTSFASGFSGGNRSACQHVFYTASASAALAACMCVYWGCRPLLCQASNARRQRDHRGGRAAIELTPPSPSPSVPRRVVSSQISGLTICFVIVGLMTLIMFITSIVLSNGYISTCREYVHRVKNFLMVTGNMVELVSNRMSCGTIYDFMDYLQPPTRQVSYELTLRHKTNPRDYLIDTSMLLTISIIMSWLSTLTWIAFAFCTFFSG